MTVERNMFPLQHHHHQQAIHQLAQLQHPGAGLPLHQPLNQQQEHHQAYQLQKHQQHQFGKLEATTKVSKQHVKCESHLRQFQSQIFSLSRTFECRKLECVKCQSHLNLKVKFFPLHLSVQKFIVAHS